MNTCTDFPISGVQGSSLLRRPWSLALLWLTLGLLLPPPIQAAGRTTQKKGVWLFNSSAYIAQGEIDNRPETVCLPKLEFKGDIDPQTLQAQLKGGIKKQKAVFHLYHDGLGRPTRKSGMVFAMDVYLMDLKMTYVGYLRQLGYSFKVSKTPAFEDSTYLRNVRVDGYVAAAREKDKQQAKAQAKNRTSPKPGKATPPKLGIGGPPIKTKWDVMPKGVLPPSIRKMKSEIQKKLAGLKSEPFRLKHVKIDPVRWATGKMGTLQADGHIRGAVVEGRRLDVWITPPLTQGWFKPEMAATLKGQPTEFILQRDVNGHEILKNGAFLAADLYFVDRGETWEDWLTAANLPPAPLEPQESYATQPITLAFQVVQGSWQGLRARALALVAFGGERPDWLQDKELIRITPPPKRPKHFRPYWRELHRLAPMREPVSVSFLVCPDGKPYVELGQKRANNLLFPKRAATLGILMERATTSTDKKAPPRRSP